MKLQASIQLPPPAPFELNLDIILFDPAAVFGKGWKFEDENGVTNGLGDGITGFVETLTKAVALLPSKKKEAFDILFLTARNEDQTIITGNDRLKGFVDKFLADPDLGQSLYKEEGQKTLNFLRDTFGVMNIEFLRRTLLDPSCNRSFPFLGSVDGWWHWAFHWVDDVRHVIYPTLVFAS